MTAGPVLDASTRVLVLTGAGVSAESGLPTFRDADGLWQRHPVERLASPEGFEADPRLVWRFYSERRAAAASVAPNPGHRALVALEQQLGDRFLLATQNVDGLHARAGSRRVVELHGNLFQTRCSSCARPPFADTSDYRDVPLPECDVCGRSGRGALLRPDIVWFGETLPAAGLAAIDAFLHKGDGRLMFVAVGTSGLVFPAANLVYQARRQGAETWLVNADPAANQGAFDHFVQGRSGEVLPTWFAP